VKTIRIFTCVLLADIRTRDADARATDTRYQR